MTGKTRLPWRHGSGPLQGHWGERIDGAIWPTGNGSCRAGIATPRSPMTFLTTGLLRFALNDEDDFEKVLINDTHVLTQHGMMCEHRFATPPGN